MQIVNISHIFSPIAIIALIAMILDYQVIPRVMMRRWREKIMQKEYAEGQMLLERWLRASRNTDFKRTLLLAGLYNACYLESAERQADMLVRIEPEKLNKYDAAAYLAAVTRFYIQGKEELFAAAELGIRSDRISVNDWHFAKFLALVQENAHSEISSERWEPFVSFAFEREEQKEALQKFLATMEVGKDVH